MPTKRIYGLEWPDHTDPLEVEFFFIKAGGYHEENGKVYGRGKFYHYKAAMSLMWPDDDHHRWSDLALKRKCENDICVFMGSSDSNKTYSSARYVLTHYWSSPDNTLWMVSSTELRGAELRIWGKLKELFNRARERYPWLPGRVLESRTCITTEDISLDGSEARVMTKGIIFIPCKSGENWVGLGAYAGIKPTKNGRLGHCGDEVSFMERSFLQAYANWFGKPNFEGILNGNPIELDDPLCTAAEPLEGWEAWADTGKTQEWRSRWYGAWVIAFDGRDSPNFDYPKNLPSRYPYMISQKKMDAVAKAEGEESQLYWMQVIGKPRPGAEKFKVFTKRDCELAGAYDDVIWESAPHLKIGALDAAYGGEGGDRCCFEYIECGRAVGGANIIKFHPPEIVPINLALPEKPDIQIARWCKRTCEGLGVPPVCFGFDGRSTLALAFAQVWSAEVCVIDFSGPPSDRPVSQEHWIYDPKEKRKRLKRCNEHYVKFVTELWWAIHYLLRGKQIRGLSREVADEGSKRLWLPTKGEPVKIVLETKEEMKKRVQRSPDLTDTHVTGIEVARRHGFTIDNLKEVNLVQKEDDWLKEQQDLHRQRMQKREINYRNN